MRKIGLIVNPLAGLGGAVGLKGSDGKAEEARKLGAKDRAPPRAVEFLRALRGEFTIVTAGGAMGEAECEAADLSALVVYSPNDPTTPQDTIEAARALEAAGVDLVVFVGGDGTAADVAAGLSRLRRQGADESADASSAADVAAGLSRPGRQGADAKTPALGVPAGVKMYSAAFADTPEAAALVAETFDATEVHEILDIDEEAFRNGQLRVTLKGTLRVPTHARVQAGKSAGDDDEVEAETLGHAVAEALEPGHTYVLGAGSTMRFAKSALGVEGTLLGLDVVWIDPDGKAHLVKADATERDLLELPMGFEVVLSPIGAQGFFLGRGNLPLSPAVLSRLAIPDDIMVVATPWKLLGTPTLKVDCGDAAINAKFPRFIQVVTGHGQTKLMRVVS